MLSIHAIVLWECVNTQWFLYPAQKHLGGTPGNVSYAATEGYPLQNSCYNLNGRTINDSIEIMPENEKGNYHRTSYNISGSNSVHTWRSSIEDWCFPLQSSYPMRHLLQGAENSTYKIGLYCCSEELFCIISDVNKNIQSPLTQLKLGRVGSLPTLSSFLFERV